MTATRKPRTLAELLAAVIPHALEGVHTATPGRVEAVDLDAQTVDVLPLIKRVVLPPGGSEIVESWPVIPSVPIGFQRAGEAFVSLPIAVGDRVLLIFCERSIDQWQTKGGEQEPADLRMHDLSSAVAIPGVYPTPDKLGAGKVSATDIVVGWENGKVIHVKPDEIDIGSENAADYVALAQLVLDRLTELETHFAAVWAILTGTPIPEPGLGAPSALQAALKIAITAAPYPSPSSVAADATKAD